MLAMASQVLGVGAIGLAISCALSFGFSVLPQRVKMRYVKHSSVLQFLEFHWVLVLVVVSAIVVMTSVL